MEEGHQHQTKKLIIPSLKHLYIFDNSLYDEDTFSGIITKDEFNEIIEGFSKVMFNCYTEKISGKPVVIPARMIILSLVSILATLAFCILMSVALMYSRKNKDAQFNELKEYYLKRADTVFWFSAACGVLTFALILYMAISNFVRKVPKVKTVDHLIKDELEEELEKVNKRYKGAIHFGYNDAKKHLTLLIKDHRVEFNANNSNQEVNIIENHAHNE